MLKRDRLKAMLRKITDEQFNAIWKETYGYVPSVIVRIWWRTLWPSNMTRSWTAISNVPSHY